MLAYDLPCPHEAGKVLHLLNRKEMGYTSLPNADNKPLSVRCLNSI